MLSTNRIQVSLFDLVTSLSDVTDLVNPALDDHHKKVARSRIVAVTDVFTAISENPPIAQEWTRIRPRQS